MNNEKPPTPHTSSSSLLLDLKLETMAGAIQQKLLCQQHSISEFELIKSLQQSGELPQPDSAIPADLELFRTHFVVFHCLYRLRQQLLLSKQNDLEISALNIQLIPYQDIAPSLSESDPLQQYYLDLNNLADTSEQDVSELLHSFWQAFARGGYELSDNERKSALQILELEADASDSQIKAAFRRLAMAHHPDRGGDEEHFKQINLAADLLLG